MVWKNTRTIYSNQLFTTPVTDELHISRFLSDWLLKFELKFQVHVINSVMQSIRYWLIRKEIFGKVY